MNRSNYCLRNLFNNKCFDNHHKRNEDDVGNNAVVIGHS